MSEPTSTTNTAATDNAEQNRVTGSHDTTSGSEAKSTCESQETNTPATSSTSKPSMPVGPDEEGLIKEMKNFDNLLKMMSVYRDNPDLRGNPNDRNIEEIAKVLSNFIGDDPDSFLRDEDGETSGSDDEGDNQVTSNGQTNEPVDGDEDKP